MQREIQLSQGQRITFIYSKYISLCGTPDFLKFVLQLNGMVTTVEGNLY